MFVFGLEVLVAPSCLLLFLTFWQRRMAKPLRMTPDVGSVSNCLKFTLQSFLLRLVCGSCAVDEQVIVCSFSQLVPPSCAAPYGYALDCIEASEHN